MRQQQLDILFQTCLEAAHAACESILQHYGEDLLISSKGIDSHAGDVVTQADHDAQDIILEKLAMASSDDAFPEVAVLAEEMEDHAASQRFERPYTLLIDPLDGTRGFLDHTNSFAVSIGLIQQDGTPVFGIAALPALKKTYRGWWQGISTCGSRALKQTSLEEAELVLYVSEAEIFPASKNTVWHQLAEAIQAQTTIRKVRPRVVGSPVHKGCLTADSGQPALYLGLPRPQKGVSLWDLAAIAAIVKGAGGHVSDIYGSPLDLNRRASTYIHHKGFLFSSHPEIARVVMDTLPKLL